jgi:antitoxin VapB
MKIAKIFKNGSSQAVRLPKEFRLPGTDVFIKKLDNIIMLIPKKEAWKAFESSLDEFSDDFMKARNQPSIQKREKLYE